MSHSRPLHREQVVSPRTATLMTLCATLVVLALWLLAGVSHAAAGATPEDGGTDGSAGSSDAGVDASAPSVADAAAPEPAVRDLEAQTAQVRAFLRGELDTAVDPATLFDVPVHDEAAIAIEAKRLAAIVERAETSVADAGPEAGPAKKQPTPAKTKKPAVADAGGTDGPDADGDAGADPRTIMGYDALRSEDPARWKARVDLDRARLAFYGLPKESRDSLLARHAERQKADAESKGKLELSAAERKAKLAEEERQNALEAARNARTEATRIVAEEHARLLGVAKQQADFEAKLVQDRTALGGRRRAVRRGSSAARARDRRAATTTAATTARHRARAGTASGHGRGPTSVGCDRSHSPAGAATS